MCGKCEYEPEPPVENCNNCYWYVYDEWYPSEHICNCKYSERYGLITDWSDKCGQWERDS